MQNKINNYIYKARNKLKTYLRIPIKPERIVIELTNRCNLNCPFCLVGKQNNKKSVAHSELSREFGKMNISLAEKIMKDAKDFGMTEILLTFQGEPLLHRQFVDFIHLSKKYGLKSHVFTNGMLLNSDLSKEIIKAGLDSIRFSVDGASEETYQLNRVGGKFEKVYSNMAEIARIAKGEKSDIELMWQFIALRNNEHEIEDARKLADKIGVPFFVKTFAESVPELVPQNEKYRRKLFYKPCKDIYRGIFVYWNGDVIPCCYDIEGDEIMGNAADKSIAEIWHGSKYTSFRKKVAEAAAGSDLEPRLCRSCLKWVHQENSSSA